jgi:hypothetical protein
MNTEIKIPNINQIQNLGFQSKPTKKIAQRQIELRSKLWPFVTNDHLWNRKTSDGFSSVPRAMPLIMTIMDDMSDGKRVSGAYLDLWTRAFDESFVTLSKPREMAFHAGFDGQRGERTWRERMKVLQKLRFIDLASGPSGTMSYAIIFNPYKVIKWHTRQDTPGLCKAKYAALMERALEIGASDLDDDSIDSIFSNGANE